MSCYYSVWTEAANGLLMAAGARFTTLSALLNKRQKENHKLPSTCELANTMSASVRHCCQTHLLRHFLKISALGSNSNFVSPQWNWKRNKWSLSRVVLKILSCRDPSLASRVLCLYSDSTRKWRCISCLWARTTTAEAHYPCLSCRVFILSSRWEILMR